jgi:hypothetical protein
MQYKPYKQLPADTLNGWLYYYRRMYVNYLTEENAYLKKEYKKNLIFLRNYLQNLKEFKKNKHIFI